MQVGKVGIPLRIPTDLPDQNKQPMTDQQKQGLEKAGWRILETGFWASPLTGRPFNERQALAMLALPDYRTRRRNHGAQLYRPRR